MGAGFVDGGEEAEGGEDEGGGDHGSGGLRVAVGSLRD
jgi:hypothetical protein